MKNHKLKVHFADPSKTIIISQTNTKYTSQADSWFENFYRHILILLASGFEPVANFKDCHTRWALSIVEDC
jgi:hypothetical protein